VDVPARASLEDFARLARAIDAPALMAPAPARVAVCRFWDTAVRAARGPLVAPLAELDASLSWTQNPNYRRQPPDAAFLDNYGYAVITGPPDGPPALVPGARVALGVLLLGPRTHYPLHAHPAVEVYVTLTPDGEWWREAGPWRVMPAGTVIHHASGVPHATRAGDTPLLAVYVWRGALGTHARLR
jgi:quercetin dioxygenase-like cupin family protein